MRERFWNACLHALEDHLSYVLSSVSTLSGIPTTTNEFSIVKVLCIVVFYTIAITFLEIVNFFKIYVIELESDRQKKRVT